MLKTIRRIRVQRIVKISSYYNKSKDQHDGSYADLFCLFFKCYFFCNTSVIVISRRQWYSYKRNLIKGLRRRGCKRHWMVD